MRQTLSAKQRRILDFTRDYIRRKRYSPSTRDIQDGCGISSTSVVTYNLRALERMGYIRTTPDTARSIEIVGRKRYVSVPVIGELRAGAPILFPPSGWRR